MFKELFNLLSGCRLLIGLGLLLFGCMLDYDGFMMCVRFMAGIMGAYLIVGRTQGCGHFMFLVGGLLVYLFVIQSGKLSVFDYEPFLEWTKISLRISSVIIFILGYRDVTVTH